MLVNTTGSHVNDMSRIFDIWYNKLCLKICIKMWGEGALPAPYIRENAPESHLLYMSGYWQCIEVN